MNEKRYPVRQCARCGQDHEEIVYKQFERPVEDTDGMVWNWWGTCPVTGDPILMAEIIRHEQPDMWEKIHSKQVWDIDRFPLWWKLP